MDLNTLRKNYRPMNVVQQQQQAPAPTSGRGGFLSSLISEIGGTGGALGGAALGTAIAPGVGTLVGALLGGFGGGTVGSVAEQKVRDDRVDTGKALREGAMEGIFAAGPLRLGKLAGGTAKGLAKGAGLAEALTTAGVKAAAPGMIASKASKALSGASDDLITRQFRFTPTQITKFKGKFGEDISETIRKFGIKNADDVATKAVQPLNQQFDDIVSALPGVKKETVQKAFMKRYKPLLSSAVTENKRIGQQLKAQADEVLKKYGDVVDAKELTALRREFDDLVRYSDRAINPASYGVNKRAADAVRESLQEAAKSQGLPLKEVGRELNKAIQLEEYVTKQANLGRGSLPASITTLLGTGVGGGISGIPGAAVGLAATEMVNSPVGRRLASTTAQKASNRLTTSGLKPTSIMGRQTAGNLAGALSGIGADQSLSDQGLNTANATMTNIATSSNNMGELSTGLPQMSSAAPGDTLSSVLANPDIQLQLMLADLQDPNSQGSNIDTLQQLFEIAGATGAQADPFGELSQSSRNALASSDNAINTLDQLEELFTSAGSGSGRLGGTLKGFAADLGFDQPARVYENLANASVTQIAKALAGAGAGTVSDMDAKVIIAALPTLRDTPQEAAAKFAALRQRLQTARDNAMLYGGGQQAPQDLAGALSGVY